MKTVTEKDLQEAIDEAIADIIGAVNKGFENVATKDDINAMIKRLDSVEVDVKDVKRTVNDIKADTPSPQELEKHDKRIARLEKAVFQS